MRTLHLFAGCGGGLLADLILGHQPIAAVEWDAYACAVLRERAADGWFPGLRVHECDVRLFDPSEYAGGVDCIAAGFPCQDISVAGKQAGVGEETRSGLYREVLRIAGVVRPSYLFLENVSAIVTNGLGTVLSDFAALGYDSEWLCLRASDCGANHQRDRWWLLGTMANSERGETHQRLNIDMQRRQEREAEQTRVGCCDVADSESREAREPTEWEGRENSSGGSAYCGWNTEAWNEIANSNGERLERQRQITIGVSAQLNNAGDIGWWEVESDVGRVANGIPRGVDRLKGLGNAQVPIQAAAAFMMLSGGN